MKMIFFGTSYFAAEILKFFIAEKIAVSAVVTKPDSKQGRKRQITFSPVKKVALDAGLLCLQPTNTSEEGFLQTLRSYQCDIFLVIAYGEILKSVLLEIPLKGAFNVHASLLPKYRGAAPIRRALLNGDKKTGVTIIEMAERMDAGDIIGEEVICIPDSMNFGELEQQMISTTKSLLPKVIMEIMSGVVRKTKQNPAEATFARKIQKEECRIEWQSKAYKIHNQIRAFSPLPGAWTEVIIQNQRKRLKILKSEINPLFEFLPGEIVKYSQKEFIIATGGGAISVINVHLEGKRPMHFTDLVAGFPKLSIAKD